MCLPATGNCLACGRMNLSQLRGVRMRPRPRRATTRPAEIEMDDVELLDLAAKAYASQDITKLNFGAWFNGARGTWGHVA